MRILAVESSCDESSLAWLDVENTQLEQQVHSQIALHRAYGGVVPDLASREHLNNLPALIQSIPEYWKPSHLAITHGPGLAGCLALGMACAQALAQAFDATIIPVNHLHGHVYSPFIQLFLDSPEAFHERFEACLPHLGLLVSGGNTVLFSLEASGSIHPLAQTVDDAAGEALDKGAKLLGLDYPGGPLIEKESRNGDAAAWSFPRAFRSRQEMKFSFSGLKTSLRYRLEALDDQALEQNLPDICASYQEAVVDALIHKTGQALAQGRYRSLGLSGGVANNSTLRERFLQLGKCKGREVLLAQREHTGDNAAMIAFAAWMRSAMPLPPLTLEPALCLQEA